MQTPRPLIQTSDTQSYPGSQPGELGPVEGISPEPQATDEPILVKGRPPVGQVQPVRQPDSASVSLNRKHTVKSNERKSPFTVSLFELNFIIFYLLREDQLCDI